MGSLITALGLVLVLEGLALVLLPGRLEEVLALIAEIGPEGRRRLGLVLVAMGVAVVALVRAFL